MNIQNIENLITLLNDGKWHSAQELTERVSINFIAQIYQARKEGYCIETQQVNNNKYEYRIAKEKTPIENLRQLAQNNLQAISHLKLLVIFGSRVSGNVHTKSDWDFGVIYDLDKQNVEPKNEKISVFQTSQIIGEILLINSDKIDVVDLEHCPTLLAHFIARDGKLIYEKQSGEFEKFKHKALLNSIQLQEIENNLHNQINTFLQEWVSK